MRTTSLAAPRMTGRQCAGLATALLPICALIVTALTPKANAAVTDLSSDPLATRPSVQAKPNLMFILDNSGSMNWSYMPDDLGASNSVADEPYTNWYGYRASQCNGLAYDPTVKYQPPLYADGTSYPNATLTSAKDDGFSSSSGTTNLSTNQYYYTYSGSQPAMGWTYTSSGVIDSTFYQECKKDTSTASSVFTKVTMTSSSSDAQNYANWYSYYRKRYLLMRTAMGRAILALDSSYRVGFTTISDASVTDGTNYFRDIKDFDSTQKSNFYSSLYSSTPNGSTPLRQALSKVGRYFAKKVSGQSYDPVQYSCQRNYALLSTDGYWNGEKGVQLDGTEIGQQDGTEARPMRDETRNTLTTVTPYTAPATRTQSGTQTRTLTWTRTSTTVASTRSNSGSCRNQYRVTKREQTATETQTQTFSTPQAGTASYNETVVTADGVIISGPTNGSVTYSGWINTAAATITTTDTGEPSDASYSNTGNSNTDCQSTAGTGVPTYSAPTSGTWSNWSPSTLTYTYSTPVVGTYVARTPTVTPSTSGGTGNTLADTAEYYYKTDLRNSAFSNCTSSSSGSSQDVCADIVRKTSTDTATWQHMNTFTIGLGVSGTLPYDKNYLTQASGSYVDLTSGAINWPAPGNAGSTSGSGGDARNVDDLWHAAVNGRGQYYSALNAGLLAEAINGVVTSVQQVAGSASAASTSSLELVAGNNNQVYRASYTTESWTGDLQAFTLNGTDATISSTATWSAQAKLDITTPSSRKIYFSDGSALQSFDYANLSTRQKGYFSNLCSQSVVAAQCATLSTADKAAAESGINLVNYLRGVRTYESQSKDASNNTVAQLYRKREHVLGDIINGAPVHVAKPPFSYSDAGYADFITAQTSRKPVVYVAANDGMLHAFSSDTSDGGTELWAYIPGAVMPNLYKLVDTSYSTKHQYLVDGAPVMGDIRVGSTWKTILVGGLNAGGRGYYALDITDPANPKPLWEFTDANMGLSFGNPVITKKADGTWVVVFASGYNNTSGDGKGHLYVLNANTGAKLFDISTGAGSTTTPSGLAKINAWIDNAADNTSKRFYGGDLLGNLWRFDIDDLVQPNQSAMLLAKFQINSSTPQPITTKPETVEISGRPVVVVATGRYLGVSDITDATQQSIYAVKDTLTSAGWGDVRADTANFVKQTFTLDGAAATATSASVSDTAVDWASKAGWWIDLPHSLERVVSNLGLQFSTLAIATAIPNGDACASGGSSWRYYLDVNNGGVVTTNPAGAAWSTTSLIVGMSWVKDSNGNVRIIYQSSDGTIRSEIPPVVSVAGGSGAHRTAWRELRD